MQKLHILTDSAKFSTGRPQLPAYNFLSTMASTCRTDRLGAVASLKFLVIENMLAARILRLGRQSELMSTRYLGTMISDFFYFTARLKTSF